MSTTSQLAAAGADRIAWADAQMPVLRSLAAS
jgi:S-adenosylhomocysteine hydrolase